MTETPDRGIRIAVIGCNTSHLTFANSYVDNTAMTPTTIVEPDSTLTISSTHDYIDFNYDFMYESFYIDRLKEIKQGWKNPPKIGNIMASKYTYKNNNIRDKLRRNKIRVNEIAA